MLEKLSDVIGISGVLMVLVSYYLLNVGKISSASMVYLWLNLIGSIFILFSLFYTWNLASVIIEIAWILISLLGMYRVKFNNNKVNA